MYLIPVLTKTILLFNSKFDDDTSYQAHVAVAAIAYYRFVSCIILADALYTPDP